MIVLIAFPTTGKSSIHRLTTDTVDFDFGFIAKAVCPPHLTMEERHAMTEPYYLALGKELIERKDLHMIFSNDICMVKHNDKAEIHVLLPDYGPDEFVLRNKIRGSFAEKNMFWIKHIQENWYTIIEKWTKIAEANGVKCSKVNSVGEFLVNSGLIHKIEFRRQDKHESQIKQS